MLLRRSSALDIATSLGVLALMLSAGLAVGAFAAAEISAILTPALVVATIAITTIIWLHESRWDAFSFLGLICGWYLATFAIGGVYFALVGPEETLRRVYTTPTMVLAMWLGALGLASLVAGYASNLLGWITRCIPALPRSPEGSTLATVALLTGLGVVGRVHQIAIGNYFYNDATRATELTGSSWFYTTLSTLPVAVIGYLGAKYYFARRAGRPYRAMQLGYYAMVIGELLYIAPQGSRGSFLVLGIMILVLRYYGLRKRPTLITVVLLAAMAIFVLIPTIYNLRNSGDQYQSYQNNLKTNASGVVDSVLAQSPSEAIDSGFTATFERFSGATSVAAILACHCDSPLPSGETVSWVATSLVPRALAPSKPDTGGFGRKFGTYYNISPYSSIAITQVGEMLMNFGVVGIFFGMLLVGAFYRVLSDVFDRRYRDPVVLGVFAANVMAAQESIVALTLVGLTKALAFTLLLFYASRYLAALVPQTRRRSCAP